MKQIKENTVLISLGVLVVLLFTVALIAEGPGFIKGKQETENSVTRKALWVGERNGMFYGTKVVVPTGSYKITENENGVALNGDVKGVVTSRPLDISAEPPTGRKVGRGVMTVDGDVVRGQMLSKDSEISFVFTGRNRLPAAHRFLRKMKARDGAW